MKFNIRGATLTLPAALFIALSTTHVAAQNSANNETIDQRLDRIEQQLKSNSGLTISGAVEVDASFVDAPGGNTSDITLSTAQFEIEAAITKGVTAHLLFLFEEDDTDPPELDEGFINMQFGDSPFSITTGQFYLPFGTFDSNLISDPLTLELGETRESAIQLNFEQGALYGSAFIFNGSVEESGDDEKIDGYGANIGFNHEGHGYLLSTSLGFLSNIADSNTLQDSVTDNSAMESTIAGVTAQVSFSMGSITLTGEYLGAATSFKASDLTFNKSGAQPSSSNFEIAYDFAITGHAATFAVAIQSTDEALALGLAEQRTAAALSVDLLENTAIALEWKHEEDYAENEGGSGDDTDTTTLQLAVQF
ncbi:MAG: LbtU family siderophore porin [Candidatus Polarisedimenticolaceae bacterium]|nr:LbtU family siderophore porin [Candidatus Polarisedimenticolaceae bacterium]